MQNLTIAVDFAVNTKLISATIQTLQKSAIEFAKAFGGADTQKLEKSLQSIAKEFDDIEKESKQLSDGIKKVEVETDKLSKTAQLAQKAFNFNQIAESADRLFQAFSEVSRAGMEFESSLAAVGAITGFAGAPLDGLGESARKLALQFGGTATSQLESFQGVLSKLGPQVAENQEALSKFATNINVLSAASGDDAKTSMNALVDTMLQLGLVTGDSAKDAETSTKVINALAASAQVGAAEIPQVAQALLGVGATAKQLNQGLDSTLAALQTLALGGKVGSEAGIGYRNVLALMVKASGPATEAYKKLGTSTAELGELLAGTGGPTAALEKLKEGLNGITSDAEKTKLLFEIFGSENASAAGILLNNIDSLKEFQEGIAEGQEGVGSAFEQAAIRMDTASTAVSKAKAQLEDAFITISQFAGQGTTALLGAGAQIAPLLLSFGAVGQIIPEGTVGKVKDFAKMLITQFVPALFASATGQGAVAGATTASTAAATAGYPAFGALWTAITGPVGIAVAAIVAIGAALYLLYENVEPVRKAIDSMFAFMQKAWKEIAPIFSSLGGLIMDIGGLIFDVMIAPWQIFGSIIGEVVDVVKSLFGATSDTGSIIDSIKTGVQFILDIILGMKAAIGAVKGFVAEVIQIIKEMVDALVNLDFSKLTSLFSSSGERLGKAFNDGAVKAINNEQLKRGVESAAKSAEEAGEIKLKLSIAENSTKMLEELDKIKKQSESLELKVKAGTASDSEIKKLDDLQKKAGEVSEKLQKLAPDAVSGMKTFTTSTGETVKVMTFLDDKVKETAAKNKELYSADLKKKQDEFTQGVQAQIQGYTEQQKQMSELEKKFTEAKGKGDNEGAAKIKEEFEALQKQAVESAAKIQEDLAKGGQEGILLTAKLNVPPEAQNQFGAQITTLISEQEEKARASKVGELLTEAASIKGNLDKANELEKLNEKFKNAKTEAERNSIAEAIKKQMPEAVTETIKGVDAQGNLIKSFEVATDKVGQNVEALKKRNAEQSGGSQEKYLKALDNEGKAYQSNKNKILELQKSIAKAPAGTDTKKQQEDLKRLQNTMKGNYKTILEFAVNSKKFGVSTADAVKQVASQLGVSVAEAQKLVNEFNKVEGAAAEAAKTEEKKEKKSAGSGENKRLKEATKEYEKQKEQLEDSIRIEENRLRKLAQLEGRTSLNTEEEKQLNDYRIAKEKEKFDLTTKYVDKIKSKAIGAKKEEIETAEKLVKESQKTQEDLAIKGTDFIINLDIESKAAQEEFDKLQIETAKRRFEIGLVPANDYIALLNVQIEKANNEAERIAAELEKETDAKKKVELQKKYNDELGKIKSFTDERLNIFKKADEDELKQYDKTSKAKALKDQKRIKEEEEILKAISALNFRFTKERIEKNAQTELDELDKQKNRDLGAFSEALDEKELAKQRIEESYAKKRQEREEKLAKERLNQELMFQQQQLMIAKRAQEEKDALENKTLVDKLQKLNEAKNVDKKAIEDLENTLKERLVAQENITLLENLEQQKQIRQQIEALSLKGDVDQLELAGLKGKLDNLQSAFNQSTDVIQSGIDSISNLATDQLPSLLSELGAGLLSFDEEAIKEPIRKFFAIILGGLKAEASAAVVKMVLNYLSWTGDGLPWFIKLAGIPAVTALVNAGVGKLVDIAAQPLLSFASGGFVDQPTIAMIGDGAKLGGRNREAIFRDDQLKQLIDITVNQANQPVLQAINNLSDSLNDLEIVSKLNGEHIYIVLKRIEQSKKSRQIAGFS